MICVRRERLTRGTKEEIRVKAGERVTLTGSEGAGTGRILRISPNEDSLMVELDDGFTTPSGVYVNMIPLLRAHDGTYRELLGDSPIQIDIAVTQ